MQHQTAMEPTENQTNPSFQGHHTYPTAQLPKVMSDYSGCQSKGSGTMLVVAGAYSVISSIVGIAVFARVTEENSSRSANQTGFIGQGIWIGALFIVAGSFGIHAGSRKTRCPITTYLVLSVITQCTAGVQFSYSVLNAIIIGAIQHDDRCITEECSYIKTLAVLESLNAVAAVVAFAAGLWGSVICCVNYCSCCQVDTSYITTPLVVRGPPEIQPVPTMQPAIPVPDYSYDQYPPYMEVAASARQHQGVQEDRKE